MRRLQPSLLLAGLQRPTEFLLVPEEEPEGSSAASEGERGGGGPAAAGLPPVWEDFFDCLGRAGAPEYIAQVACSGEGRAEPCCEPLSPHTVFKSYLSPEVLVRRHRLGLPEIKRVYQALQVYSLGFHQTMMEATSHALGRGELLVAVWRGFAMLWDGALQTVFASETVQLSKEQQAAAMSAEAALALLRASEAEQARLASEAQALRGRLEEMVVEQLAAKADATILAQSVAAAEAEAVGLRRERDAATAALEAKGRELYVLHGRLQAFGAPALEQGARSERLGQLLEEKQQMLAAGAKREAAARAELEAVQTLARTERIKREAAQARAQQLQAELADVSLKLRALQSEHVAAVEAQAAQQTLEDRLALLIDADSKADAWRTRAEAAEARAAKLEEELAGERSRNEELVESMWPLASKIKALEAQLAGGTCGSGGGGMGTSAG